MKTAKYTPRIFLILPAYNAQYSLAPLLSAVPKQHFAEIILVDDFSRDKTYDLARRMNDIRAYRNAANLGYGGNMKRCLSLALRRGADIIVELHPDGEYLPDGITRALSLVRNGAWLVLGNRFARNPLKSGMYRWKYLGNRCLTYIGNQIMNTSIPDLHQGFRVYTRNLLKTVPYKHYEEDYSFTFDIIADAVRLGIPIASTPVSTYYHGKKRGAGTIASIVYSLKTLKTLFHFFLEERLHLVRTGYFRNPYVQQNIPESQRLHQ